MKQIDFHSQDILQNIFLLENIQGGIVCSDYDPPFYLRYATEGMEHLSGYTREELLSMQQMDLVHEDDMDFLISKVDAQLAVSDTFEVEYRLKRKDGSYVHVLDRAKVVGHEDGSKYIHCLLTDITDIKQMEQALRLSEEKYKIAMQQNGYSILEYAPATHALQASENFTQIFGEKAPAGTLEDFVKSGKIANSYKQSVMLLFHKTVQDRQSCYMELRVTGKDNSPIWCALHLTPLINKYDLVYAVVGCLQNIDEQKRHIEELTELSQKDGLTNIYNRAAITSFITKHLNIATGTGCGSLIIIDIDYFKQINDTFGHDAGDELLINIVEIIRTCIQPQDLFGRLGGDEFLIFIPDVDDEQCMARIANRIVERVRNAFADTRHPVTVSLGIAVGGYGGRAFKQLYKNADTALYEVKQCGRNNFKIYNPSCPIK